MPTDQFWRRCVHHSSTARQDEQTKQYKEKYIFAGTTRALGSELNFALGKYVGGISKFTSFVKIGLGVSKIQGLKIATLHKATLAGRLYSRTTMQF